MHLLISTCTPFSSLPPLSIMFFKHKSQSSSTSSFSFLFPPSLKKVLSAPFSFPFVHLSYSPLWSFLFPLFFSFSPCLSFFLIFLSLFIYFYLSFLYIFLSFTPVLFFVKKPIPVIVPPPRPVYRFALIFGAECALHHADILKPRAFLLVGTVQAHATKLVCFY